MNKPFNALVVDDETAIRRLTIRALKERDFSCDEAVDGEQALSLIQQRKYDVVVTDLQMPKRNGHSLAVELLSLGEARPLVVVVTGVLEPKLASDLIARGIDDIHFKPIDFRIFGAKIRAMCVRRRQLKAISNSSVAAVPSSASPDNSAESRMPAASYHEVLGQIDNLSAAESEQAFEGNSSVDQSEASGWKGAISKIVATLCPTKAD